MKLALYPRNNYHLAGTNSLSYAVMLISQLPDAYNIVTSDQFVEVLQAAFPHRNVFTAVTKVNNTKHSVIVLPHVSVEQTMLFHETVNKPDYLYTLQFEDVDIMPDVKTIDTETELLKHIHFYGTGVKEFIDNLKLTLVEDVPFTELPKGWMWTESSDVDLYSIAIVERDSLNDVINDINNFKHSWTWGAEAVDLEEVINVHIKNGRCAR